MTATISRRQILSRSRDAGLDHLQKFAPYEDYEEMWFSHEHLFKDHIAEVLRKWEQIDDEIWAKMIFMSRNRRIAKAYVRVPAVIIDGSENGFDGYRVGLNGFEDPFRDMHTDKLMQYIEKGCRIGIDDNGNIVIKRYSTSGVFVKSFPADFSESCVSSNVIKARGCLEPNKPSVIFDMSKFESAMANELKSAYPDRRRLEQQCIVVVAFVRDHPSSLLDLPVYVMLINIVALDLLKSKLNPVIYQSISQPRQCRPQHPRSRDYSKLSEAPNGTTRINGPSSDCRRVPDFVSIFKPPSNSSREFDDQFYDEDDQLYDQNGEAIYGQIGGDTDYFASPLHYGAFPRQSVHCRQSQRGQPRYGQSGPHENSMVKYEEYHHPQPHPHKTKSRQFYPSSTLTCRTSGSKGQSSAFSSTTPRPSHQAKPLHYNQFFAEESESNSESGPNSLKPPKLPPRDKKKLSKQIKAIRSGSEMQLANRQDGHSIQIPSPDYLEEEDHCRQLAPSWNQRTFKASNGSQPPSIPPPPVPPPQQENIYDTMMSMGRRMATAKSAGKPSKKGTTKSNGPGYRDIPRSILDEDPYYSGMEARITSKKIMREEDKHKDRGLYWVVRKVLSSNYINLLTTKRHRRDKSCSSLGKLRPSSTIGHFSQPVSHPNHHPRPPTKSKSSSSSTIPKSLNDSSTDSDPYASINDVYEPIYGYSNGNAARTTSHPNSSSNSSFWPTMQRNKHR